MKTQIILTALLLTTLAAAQSIYEVTPGVKNNEITLQLVNISQTETTSLTQTLSKGEGLKNIVFREHPDETITLNPKEEKEITYTFDVNYNIGTTKADTIEFVITDNNSIYLTKQFILKYGVPTEYNLEQNYPNPFNPTTKIRYSIPSGVGDANLASTVAVHLVVYDILGSEVTTLVNEQKEPGYYEVEFNANNYASGVYIYRLTSGSYVSVKKMLMIK